MCLQQQLERNQVVCTKDGYQIPTETAFKKYASKNEEDGPEFLIDETEEAIPSTSLVQTAPVIIPVQHQLQADEAVAVDEGEA